MKKKKISLFKKTLYFPFSLVAIIAIICFVVLAGILLAGLLIILLVLSPFLPKSTKKSIKAKMQRKK